MLIFTGIYSDLQISTGSDYEDGAFVTGETTYIGMWTKFVYFSFAMMTLCGAGLDIKPRTWFASLSICFQMLLGLFFHVYIFGIGLLLLANKKNKYNEKSRKISQVSHDEKDSVATGITGAAHPVASELIMSSLLQTTKQ